MRSIPGSVPRPPRTSALTTATCAATLALATAAAPAHAQMPGVPVLQNGFVSPGWTAGLNGGTAEGVTLLGAAGAWTPASARYQVSGGGGYLDLDGEAGTGTSAGIRVAVPLPTPWTGRPTSRLGLTAFVGAGLSRLEVGGGEVRIPAGVGLGYRMPLGETRALSAFVTPFYSWVRWTGDLPEGAVEGARTDANLFRTAFGAEALVTARIGVTLGYETGSSSTEGERPGPTGGIFGAGVSYAF